MQLNATALSCPKTETISVYITNIGKYNEGELIGEWFALPSTTEELVDCFRRIGIDGIKYEEYFLTDYESSVNGVAKYIGEYSNLDELNYLACKLDELSINELEHFEAVAEIGDNISSVKDLINLTNNLDRYDYLPGINDESDLGYYWIDESGCYDLSQLGNLAYYFDYEKFGRDVALEQGGSFTSNGYLSHNGERWVDEYDGNDIPLEYYITS